MRVRIDYYQGDREEPYFSIEQNFKNIEDAKAFAYSYKEDAERVNFTIIENKNA